MPEKTTQGYGGDVLPDEAWTVLTTNPKAQLIDVRTNPEWTFVGVPDLSGIGRNAHLIEWQTYPSMSVNPHFVATAAAALDEAGIDRDAPIFFLCRSGARSRSAAMAMTSAGYSHAYNIAGGFEGDPDEERHRGRKAGWKASGLPWRQT